MSDRTEALANVNWIGIILGAVFLAAGFGAAYLIGIVTTLDCERYDSSQSCRLEKSWMKWVVLSVRPFPQVNAAYVQESCDDEGCDYRVAIRTSQGNYPLGEVWTSGSGSETRTADQINAFLQGSGDDRLRVSSGGGLFVLFPLIFILVGASMLLSPAFQALKSLLPARNT